MKQYKKYTRLQKEGSRGIVVIMIFIHYKVSFVSSSALNQKTDPIDLERDHKKEKNEL